MATSAPKAVPKAVPKAGAAPDTETETVAKKSSKNLIILVVLVLLATACGAAAWFFLVHRADAEVGSTKHTKVEAPKPPVFVVMEPFTVNLQSDGSEQFLQVTFTIQVADSEQAESIKLYMPQVRSRLLLLLSSKRATEINTAEGKKKLGNEIMAAINQPFTKGSRPQEVSDVFFTTFVIQ